MSAAHDDLSFEELSRSYNFLNVSSYARVLTNLIVDEVSNSPGPAQVLDIGCGKGIGRNVSLQHEIAQVAGEYWGLEPDTNVPAPPDLFFNYQHALMETADLPADYFDVVYSSMVMEHVENPEAFLNAVVRCLKPGGVYLFLTPNEASFIPKVTKWCHQLRIDELVLRMVRPSQAIEEYHYPVQFRFNHPNVIDRFARNTGFVEPEYAYIEGSRSGTYFPGPLRVIYEAIKAKRRLVKNPRRLATMICRMRKAPAASSSQNGAG